MPVHDLDLHRRDVTVRGTPDVRLSVIDTGCVERASAPTLLLVHGFGGYALQWKQQMLAFADGCRLVAPDLRGHGLSDHPRGSYAMDTLVGDLARVIEALDLPPQITLVGHSFGGAIAASFAEAFPERVERIALIGTAVDFFDIHAGARLAFRLPSPLLERIRRFFPRQLAAPAHVLKGMYREAMSKWDGSSVLSRIRQPALVVMGERDVVFRRAAYDAVPDRIRGAQIVKISVSAHLVHLERPDAVNRAIRRFLGAAAAPSVATQDMGLLLAARPWLRHYEPGVAHTLDYPRQPIQRLLDTAAQRFPSRKAIIYEDESVAYGRLRDAADRLAHALIESGVRPGDRIAVMLHNCPELVLAHFGVLKAGAVLVALNPGLDPAGALAQIEDAGAETLILDPLLPAARWMRAPRGVRRVLVARPGTSFSPAGAARHLLAQVMSGGQAGDWPPEVGITSLRDEVDRVRADDLRRGESDPDALALIEYSSGTTGAPRGVMLTHTQLMANVVQIRHWLQDLEDGHEVVLCALGLWHAYGITTCTHLGLSVAATLVIPHDIGAAHLLHTIAHHRPTIFPGVPDLYLAINDHPDVRRYDLKSIRACVCGAAPLHLEVQEVFERLTRGRLVEGYGLTEASPVTHINPMYGLRKGGSIGVPLPDTEARVVDPRTGEPRAPGVIGEIEVRGPQVMAGCWKRPDLTAAAMRDGWLRTGDVGTMDPDGYFRIVDRLADVIELESGTVYPREVEEVLHEHTAVHEVAVTPGGPGGRAGLVAHVVLRHGETVGLEELVAFCRERLPHLVAPIRVELREALPKGSLGKVAKTKLAAGGVPEGPADRAG